MYRDQNGWIAEFKNRGAYWLHDGNPARPHAVLTSGKHSTGFFNGEIILQDPMIADEAASDLAELLAKSGCLPHSVDRVVGPAMGAITIAHDLARHIGRARGAPTLRAYPIPREKDGVKTMVFEKTTVEPNERVLLVEDVLTTGASVEMAKSAVLAKNAMTLGFIAALVNRSDLDYVGGKKIIALIDQPMPMWEEGQCPWCNQGSEALRPPKAPANWQRLNGAY
jgi:orotate phosphoribosyltransferase